MNPINTAGRGIPQRADFGCLPTGGAVDVCTLSNRNGITAKIITYGGIVTELHVPDRNGKTADVVLGFSNLDGYLGKHPYFGAIVGRVAGRITRGKFNLDGQTFSLAINDPPNHLHGGVTGFDKRLWTAFPFTTEAGHPALKLTYHSPDGEEGYPGNVDVAVIYSLTDENELVINTEATTDRATPLSLTHHSYFNLSGEGSGGIGDHRVRIFSDAILPFDKDLTLLGTRRPVAGLAADLNTPRRIADVLPGLLHQHGDCYLVRRKKPGEFVPAARVEDPASGRVMEVFTDETCLQFYTAAQFDGTIIGKSGRPYPKFSAFCLECEGYPDGANHPGIDDIILRPGHIQRRTTAYRFSSIPSALA